MNKRIQKSLRLQLLCAVLISFSVALITFMGYNNRESTSIGLNTCRRIIEHHGGIFTAGEDAGRFTVSVTIPLQT